MLPVLFHIGSFPVRSYGVVLMLAMGLGIWWASRRAVRVGLTANAVLDSFPWMVGFGVLGARVVYIAQDWAYFQKHPAELWSLQMQGLTSFGGILFGLLAVLAYCQFRKIEAPTMLDLMAAPFLLGNGIGRWACQLNGCCWGRASWAWFAMPVHGLPGRYLPAPILESAISLGFLGLLLLVERGGHLRSGQSTGFAIMFFGFARFLSEFWRSGASSTTIGGSWITEAQVTALIIAAIGFLMVVSRRSAPQTAVAA